MLTYFFYTVSQARIRFYKFCLVGAQFSTNFVFYMFMGKKFALFLNEKVSSSTGNSLKCKHCTKKRVVFWRHRWVSIILMVKVNGDG